MFFVGLAGLGQVPLDLARNSIQNPGVFMSVALMATPFVNKIMIFDKCNYFEGHLQVIL